MSKIELSEIIIERYAQIGVSATADMIDRLVDLAHGLPGCAHLVGREAALLALNHRRRKLDLSDYDEAITQSVRRAQESIVAAYNRAVYSAKENIYRHVLLACAMARTDERGMFAAADVREALIPTLGRRVEIASLR